MHEFLNHELELVLSNPYIPIDEEITCMVDERHDAADDEPIGEASNVHSVDVVVGRLGGIMYRRQRERW